MRILSAFIFGVVLAITSVARADVLGCGGDDTTSIKPLDLSATPRDMAVPADLAKPTDLSRQRDARRERKRAGGRGLILVSGTSALVMVALRRRARNAS